jgi:hypothetical protein
MIPPALEQQINQGIAQIIAKGNTPIDIRFNPSEMHFLGLHGGLTFGGLPVVEDIKLPVGQIMISESGPPTKQIFDEHGTRVV